MSNTATFARDDAAPKMIERLVACKNVAFISEEKLTNSPHIYTPIKKKLTLKEVLQMNPKCAYTADECLDHDRFAIFDNKLLVNLTPESDNRFGFVSNEKSKAKGHYEYDLRTKLNKRVLWASDNTVTEKYEFYIFDDPLRVAQPDVESTRIAFPQLDLINRKRKRSEDDDADDAQKTESDEESQLLAFDDWVSEVQEWAGLALLTPKSSTENNGGIDREICNYYQPENAKMQDVFITRIKGPMSASDLSKFWKTLPAQSRTVTVAVGMPQFATLINRRESHRNPNVYRPTSHGCIGITTPGGQSCIKIS